MGLLIWAMVSVQKFLIARVALVKGVPMPAPNESPMLQTMEAATGEAAVDIILTAMLVVGPEKVNGIFKVGDR